MGWKSTINISREAAIKAIKESLNKSTTDELCNALDVLIGDKIGHNFAYYENEELEDEYLASLVYGLEELE